MRSSSVSRREALRLLLAAAVVIVGAIVVGLWQMDDSRASFGVHSPVLTRIIFVLIGVAAIIAIAVIVLNDVLNDVLTRTLGRVGHSSGETRGPRPGEGAVIHHSSGEADFDGTPGEAQSVIKDVNRDLPYPEKKSAD
jgi:uncharacterized membrane protein YuzA (DUF378 family)